MEAAIDSMQGISEEGIEIESDNIAREARIRSAYMDWCKEYGKESDESRFKVFYENFLTMEKFAEESGKEMSLNQFADCTEEEYLAITEAEKRKEAEARKAEEEAAQKAAEEKKKAEAENIAKAKAAKAKELEMKRAEAASKWG